LYDIEVKKVSALQAQVTEMDADIVDMGKQYLN
jgi:hypothetical protein